MRMMNKFQLLCVLVLGMLALPAFSLPPHMDRVKLKSSFLGVNQANETIDLHLNKQDSLYYFGNGCFWARQKSFVDVERETLGRSLPSSLVGYAGGKTPEVGQSVCYQGGNNDYSVLGHAEVVGVIVTDSNLQLPALAEAYFKSFNPTQSGGFDRPDPQDRGPAYRNIIGIPGGLQNQGIVSILEAAKKKGWPFRISSGKGQWQ